MSKSSALLTLKNSFFDTNTRFLRILYNYKSMFTNLHSACSGISRRDNTLLTVGFNLRREEFMPPLKSPQGQHFINRGF